MNRYMVGMAVALVLVASDSLAGQTAARVEYRNGRIDVGVAIGRLPVRVSPHGPLAQGWVAADWGPIRIRVASRQPVFRQGFMDRQDLRGLLGKETVKRIERHGKYLGARGKTEGRWFRVDRNTTLLEVTMGGVPVAELYDYGSDGFIDEMFLRDPSGRGRYDGRYGQWYLPG
jgi:hypothetical protein